MTLHNWDGASIRQLTALWAGGLPASEIGLRMRLTKDAVLGKVHRLRLPKRASPIKPPVCRPPYTNTARRLSALDIPHAPAPERKWGFND